MNVDVNVQIASLREQHAEELRQLEEDQAQIWEKEELERKKPISGLRGLWALVTGQYKEHTAQYERECAKADDRYKRAREELIFRQRRDISVLERQENPQIKPLTPEERKELIEARKKRQQERLSRDNSGYTPGLEL